MGDDNAQPPRPMANILSAAREGQLGIQMSPEDFIYIDRDCEFFKIEIRKIQRSMDAVSQQEHWGLGESSGDMVSASTLVDRFKTKARGAEDRNSVHQIMEDHYRIVEDIQDVHRIVRDRMMQADSNFAADFNRLNTTLPERPPVGLRFGPYALPDGTNK
ncbi:hypothetical protein OHA40_25745 [Nocardia sp. NBC_00508]|uniref:hypothetical protein n=1 Tax=Nocardia sp. NBC_00508 TaxID=2975992 RepID=UPI002E808BCD|nr:hypothetical protein [Nocardia sp. NBC_00508]WUD65038.1 hypothetical protein OHA40_25745 [Nocardia sp. NBC_00508]